MLGGDIELNPGPGQQLKVALFNARSLVNKSAFLEADVYSRNFDIMHQSIPAVPIPPPGNHGAFAQMSVPGVGH